MLLAGVREQIVHGLFTDRADRLAPTVSDVKDAQNSSVATPLATAETGDWTACADRPGLARAACSRVRCLRKIVAAIDSASSTAITQTGQDYVKIPVPAFANAVARLANRAVLTSAASVAAIHTYPLLLAAPAADPSAKWWYRREIVLRLHSDQSARMRLRPNLHVSASWSDESSRPAPRASTTACRTVSVNEPKVAVIT